MVIGDEVHHRVLALQEPRDALKLHVIVVQAFQQRPLVLDRVPGRPGVALARVHELARVPDRRPRQQHGAAFRLR